MPFRQSDDNIFRLHDVTEIVVDRRYEKHRDEAGLTLIPPTLLEFATTFAGDLKESVGLHVAVRSAENGSPNSIFLTLGDMGEYLDAAGRLSSEGYTLSTNESGIVITGASPLGAWWGTRTLLQQGIISDDGTIPMGTGVDTPGWGTRGMMIDAARHFYPKEFLIEMCAYMSFFKQNTFHVHLSDNLIQGSYRRDEFETIYARFRLWSDSPEVEGLNKYANESYTRRDFDEIQAKCAARGVAILPEIEAPGHALPIVQWRPQIGYEGDMSLLNLTHPDTLPTMKTIWREFLPWFHSKVVSIGADEYTGPSEVYKIFVNNMNDFIPKISGKSIRIWGTFPPDTPESSNEVSRDVSIQHWSYSFDNANSDYIRKNYSVLNSDDTYYIVLKYGSYARTIDINKTFHGDPATGGPWYPYVFNTKNASDNPARNEPLIEGAIDPLWNDNAANTSVYTEAYYAWREGIPALADKHWGGNLTEDEYADAFPKLHPHIPGQNLDRVIPSKGDVIFKYDLRKQTYGGIQDLSPNSYNADTSCKWGRSALQILPYCSLTTPWSSKGRDYTLSLSLKVDKLAEPTNTTVIAGSDSVLMLTPNITLFASGIYYPLNSTLPMGEWVDLEIRARGNQTFASVTPLSQGTPGVEEEFLGLIAGGHWVVMGIEAPIKEVTGWTGELRWLSLTNGV